MFQIFLRTRQENSWRNLFALCTTAAARCVHLQFSSCLGDNSSIKFDFYFPSIFSGGKASFPSLLCSGNPFLHDHSVVRLLRVLTVCPINIVASCNQCVLANKVSMSMRTCTNLYTYVKITETHTLKSHYIRTPLPIYGV